MNKVIPKRIATIERQLTAKRLTIRQLCLEAQIDESGWRRWRRGGKPPLAKTWHRVETAVSNLTGRK